MPITIASRRLAPATIANRFGPAAIVLDVTSRGSDPWVRFSPFFPHGDLPVPFSPGITSQSVEGIWQGLKVFALADIDPAKFAVTSQRGIKRSARTLGPVLGHRAGVHGDHLLDYATARHQIYLPSYRWMLDHHAQTQLADLRQMSTLHQVVLLDYETNSDPADLSHPLSHAALIVRYLANDWPAPTS